jgi:hypothetical protein
MRVLVVGAGAIGQVFGYAFSRGGAEVSFLMRPKYAEAARSGFALYPMNRWPSARADPIRFEGFSVVTDQAEAMAEGWDLVVLAISSVALRQGDWFDRLADALGGAHLLSLLAGSTDPAYILERVPKERVCWGMLAVISFQAPLPDQDLPEPGIAYWFPWLSSLGFSGPEAMTSRVLMVLRAGGMPVRRTESVVQDVAQSGPILEKTILALECAGWSFTTLTAQNELLENAVRAMDESWTLAERLGRGGRAWWMRALRPAHLRLILRIAPWIMPFDLEQFFAFHYVKVREQQRLHLRTRIRACDAQGVAHPAMSELLSRLEQ